MNTIWKFTVPAGSGVVEMPSGAKILSTAFQGNDLMIWAQVDSSCPSESVIIEVFPTGGCIPYAIKDLTFIDTVLWRGLVFHVYKRSVINANQDN